jgi:predicted RNase H-like HicB family nuclease
MAGLFSPRNRIPPMKIKAIIHEAEEGGFWAQVPAIPGCATQGGTSSSPICMRRLKAA